MVVGLLVGLGIWHASLRVGTGPASGEGLQGMPPTATAATPTTVRIGTLNMASGRGRDGQFDLGRTGRLLDRERLDLVALQEVRGGGLWRTDNQAARTARYLQAGWLYAPAETRWHCKQFGNGLVSRLPVRFWQRIPLPREYDKSHRNVVFFIVDGPKRPIHVLATHVTQRDPRDRQMQLKAVIELFLSLEEPAILLGDLNSLVDSPTIRELAARPGVDEPVGRLADSPPKGRVDWIFTRGLHCTAAGVCDEGVSDHPLYWVEIEWPDDGRDNKVQ